MYLFILIPNGIRWTADELKQVIAMLRHPEFDAGKIDPDLYKRMNNLKAIEDGRIKCESQILTGIKIPTSGHVRWRML